MTRRVRALVAIASLLVLAAPVWAHAGGSSSEDAQVIDNVFGPKILRLPAGGSIEWTNEGRSLHDVVADEGSFASGDLHPGDAFGRAFPTAGVFAYHCSYHGAPGSGMSGLIVVGDAPFPGATGGVGPGRETPPSVPAATVRVPKDAPTIQGAVDRAEPGGLVLISPGVYHEAVVVETPFLTIRGTNRNEVILDGGFELDNGVQVIEADGVSIENLTARYYLLNGFFWTDVFGYRGSFLTAYDNGDYGLFAYTSEYGQFDHSYAGGSPDSGFYIGQCNPCHALITDVLAENNALGFSGTNAGGDLAIVNSEWRNNYSGIAPNTLDSEEDPPQRGVLIAGNWVHDNDNRDAAARSLQYPTLGIGIVIAGGLDNLVTENLVEDHSAYGIAVLPNIDAGVWMTGNNVVKDNVVRSSGRADLALGGPTLGRDCFEGNDFSSSAPPGIEWVNGCGSPLRGLAGGSFGVTFGPLVRFIEAQDDTFVTGDWRTQPAPPPQPQMPSAAKAPPDPAIAEVAVPEPFRIRDARTLDVPASNDVSKEVTVLGFPTATTWWGILIGLYAYVLPLILYSAWISIALWDLVRQEAVPNRTRVLWMMAVIVVPLIGPVAYYAFARSPIQRSLRLTLVVGGLAIYVALATVGVLAGL